MTTYLITHPACLEHETGPRHPESPARLETVLRCLDDPRFASLVRRESSFASDAALLQAHSQAHLDAIATAINTGSAVDGDTAVSVGSLAAARHAAGAVLDAVDAVYAGAADNAFCAVRPPGHHAESARAMGFCLYNSIIAGAFHAVVKHRASRVAIMDFDVHHGNGSEQILLERGGDHAAAFMYLSTHESPLYPGTGQHSQRSGRVDIVNAPLPNSSDSATFRRVMGERILVALEAFEPDFLLISAGFDAHHRDPLASIQLDEDDYRWATEVLADCAATHADGRLVSVLEGGYNLTALGASAVAHVEMLMHYPRAA